MNTSLIVIGVIVVILGLFALNYSVVVEDEYLGGLVQNQSIEKPYAYIGIPLIIGGIVLLIVGAVVGQGRKIVEHRH